MNDATPQPAPAPPRAPEAPAPEAPAAEPAQAAAAQPAPEAPAQEGLPSGVQPEPARERERERKRLLLQMPVDVRSASLVVLAVLASVFALQWGQAVFIPLMLSLLLTYALAPLVDLLHRWRLPRWIGAAFILVGLFGGLGWTGYSLSGNASQLLDALPVAAQKLGQAMRRDKGASATPLESVQQAPRNSRRPPRKTPPAWPRDAAWRASSSSGPASMCATICSAAPSAC
jgi:hypothetical protein